MKEDEIKSFKVGVGTASYNVILWSWFGFCSIVKLNKVLLFIIHILEINFSSL